MDKVCRGNENCEKLIAIQTELDSYQKCVETNLQQISSLNIKYEKTVNELSNIVQIFEYINHVTDYKSLLTVINDMLIGVTGANHSTIYIFDGVHYAVEASNIKRQVLKDINDLYDWLVEKGITMDEITILKEEQLVQHGLIRFRGIKSAMVVPLKGRESLLGMIYLEHGKKNYFDEENVKYLNNLTRAIRLALENAQLYAKLEQIALVDGLTGLYNEAYFVKTLQSSIENYNRMSLPFILTVIDIDRFARVNENNGHLGGDVALQKLSHLIKESVRKDDIVCRYGADEIAVIFRNTQDLEGITQRLENMREKIADMQIEYHGRQINMTCSIGTVCSNISERISTPEELLKAVNKALREAKDTGKNKLCVYREE